MKKVILSLPLILTSSFSFAREKPIVVAVIDTGISYNLKKDPMLCKTGHEDFTKSGSFPLDVHDHGSHISGLIDQFAKGFDLTSIRLGFDFENQLIKMKSTKINYCQIIFKYYDEHALGGLNLTRMVEAFNKAIELNVDIINFSGGGPDINATEALAVKKALDKGIKFVAAAGNEGVELGSVSIDKYGNRITHSYYPAQYDKRITVVGNWIQIGKRAPSSNYGKDITKWEIGNNLLSYKKNGDLGFMTGTSQATAVVTGKLIRSLLAK